MTIYPTDDELQNAAHAYFIKNYNDLFKQFKRKIQWTVYYEKNVTSYVSFKLQCIMKKIAMIKYCIFP